MKPTYKLELTPRFIKAAKKLDSKTKQKLNLLLTLLAINPYHPKLKTHQLKGVLQNHLSFSVKHKLRVVFRFINKKIILLVNLGSHNQVY